MMIKFDKNYCKPLFDSLFSSRFYFLEAFLKTLTRRSRVFAGKTLFNEIDEDKSGYLDVKEMDRLFQKLGLTENLEESKIEFQKIDDDIEGKVEYDEFVEW